VIGEGGEGRGGEESKCRKKCKKTRSRRREMEKVVKGGKRARGGFSQAFLYI